ncbi:MAG TPA: phospho-N-acetylmuramoyl-pentapeptide-transferase [Thermomicrobiales bacterium]|nr:phospho-N-acetylmuramoyl-pentapeptide-transferase [Thermomicrobiales bacterium]
MLHLWLPVLNIAGDIRHWFENSSVLPLDPLDNLSISLALSGVAFLITLIIGKPYIEWLKAHGIGKQIRVDGPEGHFSKMGTPTMGGILFTSVVVVLTLIFNVVGREAMLLPLFVLIGCSILGAIDDKLNLVGGTTSGLSEQYKMLPLVLLSLVAALVLYYPLDLQRIYIPFVGQYDIGLLYIPIATVVIAGSANAVNFSDGLDTLSGGTAAVAFTAYGIIAFLQGQVHVVTFCFMMVGALLGFLWYNAHPAQVFMGDTGSLALGGSLATAAFMTGQWLLLVVVGAVFCAEAGSVILQRYWFKYTRIRYGEGRRIFRIAPLHHHFEAVGWSETQITMRFWLAGMMSGLLGVALALAPV